LPDDTRAHPDIGPTPHARLTRERRLSREAMLSSAEDRDRAGHSRDLAARARDLAADARDRAMAALGVAAGQHDSSTASVTRAEVLVHAGDLRKRFAQYRAKAAEERAVAAQDRLSAADDREHAARDRLSALADRELLARQLAEAETDALTGARTRAAGLVDLEHELDRCQRTSSVLTVAYVDVVGLKAVNDTLGHAAGDVLLEDVVACIRAHLRTYDLIVRVGGDEFVCAMPNMTLDDARSRFARVAAQLATAPAHGAIRVGYAQPTPDEPAAELVARADADLLGHTEPGRRGVAGRARRGRARP
jgi:diguanylate cyclase (GGDEF)-like protein